MRLKTKLVLAASAMTFGLVLVLSLVFLSELLRQRVAQTAATNEARAREVLMMTRQAVEVGLRAHPPADHSEVALHAAVTDALSSHQPLTDVINTIVRYSPEVQDVGVTDVRGYTLTSTDPAALEQIAPVRVSFDRMRDGSAMYQVKQMFGPARVLDVAAPLNRNGMPFLVVHLGIRSSFLKNYYAPFLRTALIFVLFAGVGSMIAAGLLASVAVRPIEEISRRLDILTESQALPLNGAGTAVRRHRSLTGDDAVVRVTHTIDRLGRQIRSAEEGYTALQTNLNQMLDTLRDGVLLFTPERRAVMVSDAVEHFVGKESRRLVGMRVEEIFHADTALGAAVLGAVGSGVRSQRLRLQDRHDVEIAIDRFDAGDGSGGMGTLLTLRDIETAERLEQELEVSRRLAAIGKLTAGVGHEVKNPINAMVVHLELLRGKLEEHQTLHGPLQGAQRHVDILEGEMHRLDRVVQTLADFTRPMTLDLREHDMRRLMAKVVELTSAELTGHDIALQVAEPAEPVVVCVDGELIQQALLNLVLNGMQAMPEGGQLALRLRRERQFAVLEVVDNGQGIPPEVMPRIFELYFTTKEKGSGIGLAMTYRILQMHGGAMEVWSTVAPRPDLGDLPLARGREGAGPEGKGIEAEHGTAFTLKLPIVAPAAGGLA